MVTSSVAGGFGLRQEEPKRVRDSGSWGEAAKRVCLIFLIIQIGFKD